VANLGGQLSCTTRRLSGRVTTCSAVNVAPLTCCAVTSQVGTVDYAASTGAARRRQAGAIRLIIMTVDNSTAAEDDGDNEYRSVNHFFFFSVERRCYIAVDNL